MLDTEGHDVPVHRRRSAGAESAPGRLPRADYAALAPHLTDVAVPHQQVVATRGQPLRHVYFPGGAIPSVLVAMDDGQAVEGAWPFLIRSGDAAS